MEAASAQKYDKKSHKEHKYEKEHKDKPDSYKPDGYKPDGYKPDGHKPDGYKPDSYKPERPNDYRPDGYRPADYEEYKYGKDAYTRETYSKEPYGKESYGKEPYGSGPYEEYNGGYNGYDSYSGYSDDEPLYGKYGQPSPYDGGYWGGRNGRHIIHLQAVYAENMLNASLIQPGSRAIPNDKKCSPDTLGTGGSAVPPVRNCDNDFGLICAWRHHDNSYSKGSDYSTGKYGPIFKTAPVTPTALGKGWINWDRNTAAPVDDVDLVTFNGHQIGYKWATINGFMTFETIARNCHPLLGPTTTVTFNSDFVPVYLIFGKIQLPVNPAIVVPLGGFGYISERTQGSAAEILSKKDKDYSDKPDTSDYKSTPEGNKYKFEGNTAYVYNEKDNTLCGLSFVARGDVKLTVTRTGQSNLNYAGTMEWPIIWTDLITTLPLLIDDRVEAPARAPGSPIPIGPIVLNPTLTLGDIASLYLEKTLDRIAAVCKTNDDIPWVTPGAITLDVAPVA